MKTLLLDQLKLRGSDGAQKIAFISLNRPEAANSLSSVMIEELSVTLSALSEDDSCRAVVLQGAGRNFCAGADLTEMRTAAQESKRANLAAAEILHAMFETVANMPMPTVALVRGAAYGGGVGLAAACDLVIAEEGARFSLSEIRLGLIPAIIMPYVARRIPRSAFMRFALSGKVLTLNEALSAGLIDISCAAGEAQGALRVELGDLLQGAPGAQRRLKTLYSELARNSFGQDLVTARTLAEVRSGEEAQAGLQAFFTKGVVPWAATLSSDAALPQR